MKNSSGKKLNWVKNKFYIGYRGKSARQTNVRINQFTIIYLQQNTMTGLTDDVIFKWNTDCTLLYRDIKTFIEIVCWLHFIQGSGANMSLPTFKHEYRLAHSNKLVWFVIFTPAEVLHLLLLLPPHLMAQSFILEILQYKYFYTPLYFSWLPPRVSRAVGYFAEHDIDWWRRSIILLHQF